MRLMRLRDQVELTKEMTDSTVIYLSPHYRQLSASGVAEDAQDTTHNMYNELSMQFGALTRIRRPAAQQQAARAAPGAAADGA